MVLPSHLQGMVFARLSKISCASSVTPTPTRLASISAACCQDMQSLIRVTSWVHQHACADGHKHAAKSMLNPAHLNSSGLPVSALSCVNNRQLGSFGIGAWRYCRNDCLLIKWFI